MQNTPITKFIPQRPPFVMVDRVTSCDDVDTTIEFTIRQDNIFLDNAKLSAAGIIENMAQSCAARMGCMNMLRNEPVKIGYIGDIRGLEIMHQPRLGDVVTTLVHIEEEVFHLTLASVSSMVGDKTIASARVKIALTTIEAEQQ